MTAESNKENHIPLMRKVCEEIHFAVKLNLRHFTEDINELICDSCGVLYIYCEKFKFPSVLMLDQFYSFCSGYCKWEYISDVQKIQKKKTLMLREEAAAAV
jgi:hypothetical protein